MHKVITFLGVRPQDTEYSYSGKTYKGRVFAQAVRQFQSDFDQMLVFVTESAYQNAYQELEDLHDERIKPVHIPNGETTAEMWATFEAVTNAVDEHDTVTFDITHGLRSIPFLVFLAAAFLKSAKQVTIRAIYYGALELGRDASGALRPAPVIDLTEFISLLDWLDASNQFVRLGDAAPLAQRLLDSRPHHTVRQWDEEARQHSKQIDDAAAALNGVSLALRLVLPDQAMEASDRLRSAIGRLDGATRELARPFTVLADQVANAYAPLAQSDPYAEGERIAALGKERQMVKWYLDRGLLVQAVVLAREWLVTWGVVQAGLGDPYDNKVVRDEVEKAFGEAGKGRGSYPDHVFSSGRRLHDLPSHRRVIALFGKLGDVRNTLCHANKRLNHVSPQKLEKNARKWCQELYDLPLVSNPQQVSL